MRVGTSARPWLCTCSPLSIRAVLVPRLVSGHPVAVAKCSMDHCSVILTAIARHADCKWVGRHIQVCCSNSGHCVCRPPAIGQRSCLNPEAVRPSQADAHVSCTQHGTSSLAACSCPFIYPIKDLAPSRGAILDSFKENAETAAAAPGPSRPLGGQRFILNKLKSLPGLQASIIEHLCLPEVRVHSMVGQAIGSTLNLCALCKTSCKDFAQPFWQSIHAFYQAQTASEAQGGLKLLGQTLQQQLLKMRIVRK